MQIRPMNCSGGTCHSQPDAEGSALLERWLGTDLRAATNGKAAPEGTALLRLASPIATANGL
jgi:hypothetical protein